MKKSEIIKRLCIFADKEQLFDLRDQYDYSIAKKILQFLEDEGMVPPLLYTGTQTEPTDIYDWESEDV